MRLTGAIVSGALCAVTKPSFIICPEDLLIAYSSSLCSRGEDNRLVAADRSDPRVNEDLVSNTGWRKEPLRLVFCGSKQASHSIKLKIILCPFLLLPRLRRFYYYYFTWLRNVSSDDEEGNLFNLSSFVLSMRSPGRIRRKSIPVGFASCAYSSFVQVKTIPADGRTDGFRILMAGKKRSQQLVGM